MYPDLKKIFDRFNTGGTFSKGEPYGSGHIHDTFRIGTAEKDKDDYILQRLNNKIFRNIPELQQNIERVTLHLRKKIGEVPGSDIKRECLCLINSRDNKSWIIDETGNYWDKGASRVSWLAIPQYRWFPGQHARMRW